MIARKKLRTTQLMTNKPALPNNQKLHHPPTSLAFYCRDLDPDLDRTLTLISDLDLDFTEFQTLNM